MAENRNRGGRSVGDCQAPVDGHSFSAANCSSRNFNQHVASLWWIEKNLAHARQTSITGSGECTGFYFHAFGQTPCLPGARMPLGSKACFIDCFIFKSDESFQVNCSVTRSIKSRCG